MASGLSRNRGGADKVRLKADPTTTQPATTKKEAPRDAATEHDARKRAQAEQRRRDQDTKKIQSRISELEARIADREQAMKESEAAMSAPGFYDDRSQAQPLIDRHQTLMYELGDLMHRWEDLHK